MRKRKQGSSKTLIDGVKNVFENRVQSIRIKIPQLVISIIIFIIALILGQGSTTGRVLFCIAFIVSGIDLVIEAIINIVDGKYFNKYLLIVFTGIIALVVGLYAESTASIILFQLGILLIKSTERHYKMSISHLLKLKPGKIKIVENGTITEADVDKIMPGEAIIVGTGEFIPLDGVVRGGSGRLDTYIVTGSKENKYVTVGDNIVSGCINRGETLTLEVTKSYQNSNFNKLVNVLRQAVKRKSDTELFITRIARIYTPVIIGLAILIAILPPLITGKSFAEYIARALSLMLLSYPCSLIMSVPISYFIGIGVASKIGVVIKSGNAMDALADIHTAVFDKTGILTKGKFEVTDILPIEGLSKEGLLMIAAYAEQGSNHPIARSIVAKYSGKIEHSRIQSYTSLSGSGVHMTIDGNSVYVGSDRLMKSKDILVPDDINEAVYVAVNGKYAGAIVVNDAVRKEAPETIQELKKLGVERTIVMTGDKETKGEHIAEELKMDQAFCELLPDEKAVEMEDLNKSLPKGRTMIFVGDGINDEPVIAAADAGIAMGGMSSGAVDKSSDVVIMDNELRKIPVIVKLTRYTRKIARENIVFALFIKTVFIILGALGIGRIWMAVILDTVICLITVLNSLRIMDQKWYLNPIANKK